MSRSDFPAISLESMNPTMSEVVEWCPVPKAILGSIRMSYFADGMFLWNDAWMTHWFWMTKGSKQFFSHTSFQSLSSASLTMYVMLRAKGKFFKQF